MLLSGSARGRRPTGTGSNRNHYSRHSDIHLSVRIDDAAQGAVGGGKTKRRQTGIHHGHSAYRFLADGEYGQRHPAGVIECRGESHQPGGRNLFLLRHDYSRRRGIARGSHRNAGSDLPAFDIEPERQHPHLRRAPQSIGRADLDFIDQRLADLLHCYGGATWLSVSPAVGIVLPGELTTLTVGVNATTLAPQAAPYTANITVVASGASVTTKSQNIVVNATVNSITPTIASVWPPVLPENAGRRPLPFAAQVSIRPPRYAIQGVPAPLTTTILSPSALLAVVPAALLTGGGVLNVVVENPAPGGSSAPVGVTVANVPTIYGVFNAASYASATFSPGELITMFGSNIGPPIPATMSVMGGYVTTNLSNVIVTIDGQDAPVLYVSSDQVTVQVPYESTIGAGKAVVVSNGANPPATTTVTIAAEAPGIFTADGSGVGEAAAINTGATSGLVTLNSSTDPAKIGDTVTLFLTGEGNYNPVPLSGTTNTGYIIPLTLSPLPQLSPLPTVKIGGVDASAGVSYAGVVPGSIIGLLQITLWFRWEAPRGRQSR